ncbi:MAG: non-canonical purine NTP pyrophosphatase, partial [Pseudomonadota bacterium]
YEVIKRPCIVEYAGLVLEDYAKIGYPGGLTQPMWDTLEADNFVQEMGGHGRAVRARAYVGYCDGLTIQTFIGETKGKLVGTPSGTRPFYWDPVFAPRGGNGKTYAEICPDDRESSLLAKVKLSQSAKALRSFLEFRINAPRSELFPDR